MRVWHQRRLERASAHAAAQHSITWSHAARSRFGSRATPAWLCRCRLQRDRERAAESPMEHGAGTGRLSASIACAGLTERWRTPGPWDHTPSPWDYIPCPSAAWHRCAAVTPSLPPPAPAHCTVDDDVELRERAHLPFRVPDLGQVHRASAGAVVGTAVRRPVG